MYLWILIIALLFFAIGKVSEIIRIHRLARIADLQSRRLDVLGERLEEHSKRLDLHVSSLRLLAGLVNSDDRESRG